MNIAVILRDRALSHPTLPAVVDRCWGRRRVTTFAQLDARAAHLAAQLHLHGIQAGDRLLVFYPISAELYAILGAIWHLGAIAMLLDPGAGRAHVERSCRLQPPRAFIGTTIAHSWRWLVPSVGAIPLQFVVDPLLPIPWTEALFTSNVAKSTHRSAPQAIADCQPGTPALLTFTSGSTGDPKPAIRSHGLLLAQYRVLSRTIDLEPGERDLTVLPIFAIANLAAGVTSYLPPVNLRSLGRVSPRKIVETIRREQLTRTAASPALLSNVVDRCLQTGIQLPSLRKIYCGGAPVFPALWQKLQRVAPQAEVTLVYGSTEVEPIACVAVRDIGDRDVAAMHLGKGMLVGKPVPELELQFFPEGSVGEIGVRGGHVLTKNISGNSPANIDAAADGDMSWHHTGDAGYLDDRGRLWLLGCVSAAIADVRGTLYPLSVEAIARSDERVRHAALISHGGQRVLLLELVRKGGDRRLPAFSLPAVERYVDRIVVVSHLPLDRRHNAKIDYPELRAWIGRGRIVIPRISEF